MKTWKFIPGKCVENAIEQAPKVGKHQLEPLSSVSKGSEVSFNILEDHQFFTPLPEVHRHEADLWIGVEGELKFIVGGKMVGSRIASADGYEIKAREIKGGDEVLLKPNDVLLIPAGVPHAHTGVHGRAYIIKIPERDIVPFEEVPGWNRL